MRLILALICVLAALAFSGCESRPPVAGCAYTYECAAGSICRNGACVAVVVDPVDAGVEETDAGQPPRDAGQPDASVPDAGVPDAGADAGTRLTFAPGAYRRCTDDLECAVFGGNCVVELTLSRPADGGVDRVRVSDLDPSFATGEGVCTLPCTSDPRICDSITVTSPTGASAPFTCQVVYAADSPYPSTAPAFPFDTQLDATAMARGVPFASVCRPPFQFALTHSETFCQACTEDMQCGATGACYLERAASTPRSGSCVESCSAANPCAFGFTCGTLPGSTSTQTFCLPRAGTCGRCRDSDGDLRGVGRCGPITQPNTAVDCDDSNPVAYFDPANPGHAFPAVCAASDVNCNGKSDDVEQLGSVDHCSACGDVCVGRAGDIAHARRACLPRTTTSSFACVADCEPGYADCDGDVSNGCEQQLGANSIYAEDADGDLRGSMTNFRYVCSGAVPSGWVANRLDCNDNNPNVFGGNSSLSAGPELCDGLDNNCNGVADDPGFIVDEGTACNTGVPGVCAAGNKRCDSVPAQADGGAASGSFSCIGVRNPTTQASVAEACDGLDNNCNGQTDEGLDYYEANGQQNPNGSGAPVGCPIAGGKGICGQGVYACTTATSTLIDGGVRITGSWTCAPNQPEPTDAIDDLGIDSNCDGSDGDLSAAIFVRPVAGAGALDGNDANLGSAQRPVATLTRALALACAGAAPCKDIYLAAAEFSSASAIVVPTFAPAAQAPVRIYGGFQTVVTCPGGSCQLVWTRGTDVSTVVRNAPARVAGALPFGASYAAFEADTRTNTVLSLRLDQVRVEVNAPDPSTVLTGGEHAASQVGLVCPPRGCGALEFRNVAFAVEAAMGGANGVAATPAPLAGPIGRTLNGTNGCLEGGNCSGYGESPFGFYAGSLYDVWDADGLPGRAAPGCADGRSNHGGSSAGIFWLPSIPDPGFDPYHYEFNGRPGLGLAGGQGGFCTDSQISNATRGANGAGGAGGLRPGSFALHYRLQGGAQWAPHHGFGALVNARFGQSGSGGGGGCGCRQSPFWPQAADHLCPFLLSARGGGGGAGGCGGSAGGAGGDGGNAIGLLLNAPAATDLNLTTSGTFTVAVGNGGKGGNGAAGGNASAGGYGGVHVDISYLAYSGGHGGDGGGGGGGAGGVGGSSIGVFRACARSGGSAANGCGINVPPLLLAAPGQFVTVGAPGAAGTAGAAGTGTAKLADTTSGRVDVSTPQSGLPGASGVSGRADHIYFAITQVVP